MAEFRTRLKGADSRDITAENVEKSQHTDFNEDKTNESASVACSHVRLWKLDTQKETHFDAFEMKGLRRFYVFCGQQRKQMIEFSTKLE